MNDQMSLDFLRLIAKAIDRPDSRESLVEAFDEILRSSDEGAIRNLKILIEQVSSPESVSGPPSLVFECPNGRDERVPLLEGQDFFVGGLHPGDYVIRLWSGVEVWRGLFRESWLVREGDEEVRLAASVKSEEFESVHHLDLLDGEITIDFFPGYEVGRARVRWNRV